MTVYIIKTNSGPFGLVLNYNSYCSLFRCWDQTEVLALDQITEQMIGKFHSTAL